MHGGYPRRAGHRVVGLTLVCLTTCARHFELGTACGCPTCLKSPTMLGNGCCVVRTQALPNVCTCLAPGAVSSAFLKGAETVVLDALWNKPECHTSHFGIEQVRRVGMKTPPAAVGNTHLLSTGCWGS